MTITQLLLLGLVIGSNNLATALALGALGQLKRRARIVTIFGIFEFLIPLIGLWLGQEASHRVIEHTRWVSAGLLAGLGIFSLVAARRHSDKDDRLAERITSVRGTILLAAGLSIDNLIVGFGLGLRDAEPVIVAATIAIFSMTFTWIGMRVGDSGRRHWERYVEAGAGLLLIGLGIAAGAGWV